MIVLEAIPQSWFSQVFNVLENGVVVAQINPSGWREKGVLSVGDSNYHASSEGWIRDQFLLSLNTKHIAVAERAGGWLSPVFDVKYGDELDKLTSSWFKSSYTIQRNGQEIGSITPTGILARRVTARFPDDLPRPVQIFIIWVTNILRARSADVSVF